MSDTASSLPPYSVDVVLVCNNQHRHPKTCLYHPDTNTLDLPYWPNCPVEGCGADWQKVDRPKTKEVPHA